MYLSSIQIRKYFTFEQYVIISNTIISIILLMQVYFKFLIVINTIHFLHMIVLIFINKRLIKTYYAIENIDNSGIL